MSQASMDGDYAGPAPSRPQLDRKPHVAGALVFFVVLLAALSFTAASVLDDISKVGETNLATGTFVLLGLALLIALGFEFVNGFHDTANAVATVIYTHSLPPMVAVVWSGTFNFLGVLTSTGAVAYSIVNLLPVELILQVGSGAGYAMIFALLIAAIIWNLGTWAFGIPSGRGARAWHHGGLEADRGHCWREDRQNAPDLRPGCLGRDRCDGHHWPRRGLRPSGLHDAYPFKRRRGHHGGQRLGPAMGHAESHGVGLGYDPPCRDGNRRLPLHHSAPGFLSKGFPVVPTDDAAADVELLDPRS